MTKAQAEIATQEFSLSINRTLKAPLEKVYRAWTDPATLSKWFGPFDVKVTKADIDLVPGGKYRIAMKDPEGKVYIHHGVYKVIERNKTLAFTWNASDGDDTDDETYVTIKFQAVNDGTTIQLTHEHFASGNARDLHNQGWDSCFDNLESRLFSA